MEMLMLFDYKIAMENNKYMTLDKCMKCQNYISYHSGFVVCNFWKLTQQHVTNINGDGQVKVVGCSKDDD